MHRRDESSVYQRFAVTLAASVGVHLLLAFVLSGVVSFEREPTEPGAPPTSLRPVEVVDARTAQRLLKRDVRPSRPRATKKQRPKEKVEPKKPDRADGQVVHIPPPPREERPTDAKLLSEYDSKVDKQQVSRDKRPPSPRVKKADRELISTGSDDDGDTKRRDKVPKRKQVNSGAAGPGDKRTPSERPGLDALGDPSERRVAIADAPKVAEGGGIFRRAPDDPSERARNPGGGGEVGGHPDPQSVRDLLPSLGYEALARSDGSIDHLDDVDEGDATFLNTREWKHAWFFNRVKRTVQRRWHAVDRHRRHDPYGRVFGVRDRLTVLDVTIKADGSLEDVYVVKDCGVAFLDEAAVQAFREAQPFPNPPLALQDSDGNIRFKFGFYLEIHGRGGFRGDFLR